MPWLALIVAIAAGLGTLYNSSTSRKTYDRTSGQVRARIEVVATLPGPTQVPPQLQKVSPITKQNELTLGEVEDFFRVNPRVVLKNVGDEPIDAIRLETRSAFTFIDMLGEPEERQRQPTPWVLEEAARDDYPLTEKLKPGKSVEVGMIRGLLSQMAQLQARDREDRPHYARFEVRCLAKLVGATAYDGMDEYRVLAVRVVWYPKGFPDEKCKRLLAEFRPVPNVEP